MTLFELNIRGARLSLPQETEDALLALAGERALRGATSQQLRQHGIFNVWILSSLYISTRAGTGVLAETCDEGYLTVWRISWLSALGNVVIEDFESLGGAAQRFGQLATGA